MEVLVCRTRAGTLSLRAQTSLTLTLLLSVAIWSRVFDVSRPPIPYTQPGDATVESLGFSAPQGKGEPCRRKEGGKMGEFKQACLIGGCGFLLPCGLFS